MTWELQTTPIANAEHLGDWEFKVSIHESHESLNEWRGRPDEIDACCFIDKDTKEITLHFSKDRFEMSLVAHEAAHAAFFAYRREHWNKSDKISLMKHPEELIERIGNLTAIIWFAHEEYWPKENQPEIPPGATRIQVMMVHEGTDAIGHHHHVTSAPIYDLGPQFRIDTCSFAECNYQAIIKEFPSDN